MTILRKRTKSYWSLNNLCVITYILCWISSSWAKPSLPTAILVDNKGAAAELEKRIVLDPQFSKSTVDKAELIWVLGAHVEPKVWQQILVRVKKGAGLIVVPGTRALDLASLGLRIVGERSDPVTLQTSKLELSKLLTEKERHYFWDQIVWPTAPQAGKRWILEPSSKTALTTVITEYKSNNPVFILGQLGKGHVALTSLQLLDSTNREFVLWPYFNYLLYTLAGHTSGCPIEDFANWQKAPVPGPRTMWSLVVLFILIWVSTLLIFIKVRRHSRNHPEILDNFFVVEEKTSNSTKPNRPNHWNDIGFARSLAGFLTLAGALFVLFAPYYYLTNILIPNTVQPFPQAKGIWEFVCEALQIAWFLFDAGTFVAFVKYFAEYRHKSPREALQSAQFFVWWQMLTGLVQVTMASLLAIFILPHTRYGYSSYFVILLALTQYPGIFAVINFFFQAYQRYDYNINLDLLADWVLRFVLQIPFVLYFRAWGVAHPEYGEAFGAAIGIGLGYYFSQIVTFVIATFLYKRLGLKLAPLFMAHFDYKIVKRMLTYGLKNVLGKMFFRGAKFIDRLVISILLINYTEWLGLEGQIYANLMFLFPIAYRFFETAMAALSESHGNGKPVLTQYYISRFFQVGSLYTAIALSLFMALGATFVHHAMDPQWARASDYMGIAAIAGAFSAAAWLSDMLQNGAGRPGLFAWVLGVEQVLRIALFCFLIPHYHFTGYYLALLFTIIIKVIGAWILNHRLIIKIKIYFWQMFFAPALAGLFNYALLRFISSLLNLTGRWEVLILFFTAALGSFFVCFFALGLVGGMDRALAQEFDQASQMTGPLRPITRIFYYVAKAGWSLSPLHNRFPMKIHEQAMLQAKELQRGC